MGGGIEASLAWPDHVPPELVRDLDIYNIPGLESGATLDVHRLWKNIQDDNPRMFWTPRYGGHWVATRYSEIERLVMEHETFSNFGSFVPSGIFPFQTPVQMDPPEHGAYRKLLIPTFAPKSLAKATQRARAAAIDIIERLKPQRRCEFVGDFAGVMPIIAFLTLIELPPEDNAYLRSVAVKMNSPANPDCAAGWTEMSDYVRKQIALRRTQPRDDLITSLLNARVFGRPLTADEIFSMCLLVIGGGLDTVVSMTSFAASYLAQHPEYRRQLIDRPELLDNAVNEIARRFGTSNLARNVRHDAELGGVTLKEGDIVLGIYPLAGLDERVNDDPMTLDWERVRPKHLAFGCGPHLCIGMHLAKREIRIFLEEWLARIPDFRIAEGTTPRVTTGIVNSMVELQLEWA